LTGRRTAVGLKKELVDVYEGSMLGNLVKSWIRPLGLDIVKYPPLTPLARQLRSFLRSNDINLVLDIGACDGGFCRFLRGPVGYAGRIVSFEPTAKTFDTLTASMAADPNWIGYNIGVSDADSQGILNTYGDRYDFNSVLDLRERDAAAYDVDTSRKGSERISLRTVDSLWLEISKGIEQPRVYLKTDTQGHDPAVIRGAAHRLENIIGLQSEVAAIQIYEGMTSMPETLTFLKSLGYSPIGFHPVNQPEAYAGMTPEFDVMFMRDRDVAAAVSVSDR
jgi:FkbM family methyltransferase